MERAWTLLHLFFAFSFVGTLVVADWNSRAARATEDWGRRAVLFDIIARSSRIAGFGSLLMLGVFGNLLAVRLDYRMAADAWLRWTNGLWLAAVLIMLTVCLPGANRLVSLARAAVGGGAAEGYPAAMARWRIGNAVLSVLYVALLALMVFRWKS
jgi:hypothetical protein